MTRLAFVTLAALAATGAQQPAPDIPVALARAEAALGGSALATVKSFTVRGTLTRRIGGFSLQSNVDMRCVLPRQFVVITTRHADRGPLGSFRITEYAGFNADDPIDVVDAPDSPVPVRIPAVTPATPAEAAAVQARLLRRQRARFGQLALVLFAASPEAYPLAFSSDAAADATAGPVVTARSTDGGVWHISFDPVTHLPATLRWQDRPIAVASATSTLRAGPGGQPLPISGPPALPAGDPTAGMPDVEWRLEIDNHRSKDGLTWPRRLRTFVAGQFVRRTPARRLPPESHDRSGRLRTKSPVAAPVRPLATSSVFAGRRQR